MPRALTISFGFVSEFAVNGSSQILTSARFHRFDISCLWKLMKMKSKSLLNEYREFRFHVVHQRMDADSSYTQRQFLFIDYIEISRWLSLHETHIPCKMCRVTTNYICFFFSISFGACYMRTLLETRCVRETRGGHLTAGIQYRIYFFLIYYFYSISLRPRHGLNWNCVVISMVVTIFVHFGESIQHLIEMPFDVSIIDAIGTFIRSPSI